MFRVCKKSSIFIFISGYIIGYLIIINFTSNDSNPSKTRTATDVEKMIEIINRKEKDLLEALLEISELRNQTSTKQKKNAIVESVKSVKVLCWVMTQPKNHQKKAIHVKRTWGRRCNKLIFISSKSDPTLPTTVLKGHKGIPETRKMLWAKTRRTFQLIYKKYLNEADFFLKADDDTYVVVENLRYLLKDYKSSIPSAFGCDFKLRSKNASGQWKVTNYNSGGAGYVLSKGAVKALIEKGYKSKMCKQEWRGGHEDVNLGECLQAANVNFVDTRDKYGRYKFLAFSPIHHLIPGNTPKWWSRYVRYPQKTGIDCCSYFAISFHYIKPKEMYLFEYFIYYFRPYGMLDFGTEDDQNNQTLTIKKI